MTRRAFAYDLDHGNAEPLPPAVEAFLDAHPDRPINPADKVLDYIEQNAKQIDEQRHAFAWLTQWNTLIIWREVKRTIFTEPAAYAWHIIFTLSAPHQETFIGAEGETDLSVVVRAAWMARRDA